jgi:hypothetical protein
MGPRAPTTARTPHPTEPSPRRTPRRPIATIAFVALALAILAVPGALVTSSGPSPAHSGIATAATSVPGPSATWAWGALANFSASVQYVGAYNASQNLTGGNLTSSGAYVALDESVGLQYAAFVVVNATTPSATDRYVQVDAAELRVEHIAVAASGTFPVAGNYSAGAAIPLAPMNFSLAASVAVLDLAAAYLNFTTGPNGSLALANEHVEYAQAVNISLSANQFPNVTRDAAGNVGIKYVTASIVASAWQIENLSATFSPALPLVVGPLFVGKSWNATSTASFNGSVAWAETIHATSATGATGAMSTSGSASARATVPVALSCDVLGTAVVRYPNGTPETDYVIACANATGSEAYLSANGLVVLPTTNSTASHGLAAAVPVHAATAPASPAARTTGASLYSPSKHMAASERGSPSAGEQVTASPMSDSAARAGIHGLGTPERPAPVSAHGSVLVAAVVVGVVALVALGAIVVVARRQRIRP